MDRAKILEKYRKEDEKLLVSKLLDKIELSEKQNKIQTTDFLSPIELKLCTDVLTTLVYKRFVIYGGTQNAQRNIIIIYPDKLADVFEKEKFDYNSVCNCVRISNCQDKYDHKVYLGGMIKLGLKREKIGDIIVVNDGADIIIEKELTKFLLSNLQQLTRFKKCIIELIDLQDVTQKEQEYQEFKIIVSSLRLDSVVAELSRTSRGKATEILKQERVYVNYKNEVKNTKLIQPQDIITIRGVGKFIIDEISGNTKSGKNVVMIKKFV